MDSKQIREEENFRKKIFNIIQIGYKSNPASRAFDIFIVAVIVCNIAATFLQTFDELEAFFQLFRSVEIFPFWFFASNMHCGSGLRISYIRTGIQ